MSAPSTSPASDAAPRRILTNMCFHQSALWLERTDSIYPLSPEGPDPTPLPPWREALRLFRRRSDYPVVVTMGARESLAYGMLCLLLCRPSRQIMTEVFIDDPKHPSLAWRMKRAAYSIVAHRAIGILTNSRAEIHTIANRFSLPSDRLRFVPMHTTIDEPRPCPGEGFLFSGGRSLRDYPLLIQALEGTELPTVIACGTHDLQGIPLPDAVDLRREVDRETYVDLLQRADFVVVPLRPSSRSTGQVVVIEAMSFGKAVIATDTPGTRDIIRPGENGLLVAPGSPNELQSAIRTLQSDPALRGRLGSAALQDVQKNYGFDRHAEAKLRAIAELWMAPHSKTGAS